MHRDDRTFLSFCYQKYKKKGWFCNKCKTFKKYLINKFKNYCTRVRRLLV